MTIKPHLGVLVALVLLLRRDWTAIGWAAATTGALALVSGSLFGFELWPVYVLKTLLFQADLFTEEVTRSFYYMLPTTSEIGSAACRDRVGQYVALCVGAVPSKKKKQ